MGAKRFGLTLRPDGGYFYLVLLLVSLSWSITIGLTRAFGVFIPVWMGYYGASMPSASFVFMLLFVGSCLNSLVGPFILSALGSRKMMVIAALGCSACWVIAGQFSLGLYSVQLVLGLANGFFSNMHFYISNIVFQGWMEEKRILGNGIVFCGVPLGGLIFSPFWTALFESYTWRGAALVQAGLSLQNVWISLLIIECPSSPIDRDRKPIAWDLFRSGGMLVFALSQFLYFGAYSSILLIVPYMVGKGFTQMTAAMAVTIQTVSEILLRPVLGVALNSLQKHKLNLMALAALILSASLAVIIVANSYRAFIAVMVFQGAAIAFCGGLPTSIICDLAGYNKLPTAFVFFAFTMDASFMIGPLLYSNLSEFFFQELIYISAAMVAMLSFGTILLTKCFVEL